MKEATGSPFVVAAVAGMYWRRSPATGLRSDATDAAADYIACLELTRRSAPQPTAPREAPLRKR